MSNERHETMQDRDPKTRPKREYPPFYERVVPIALLIIVVAIAILLIVVLGVLLGLFPGAS
jgi:hypothetical protein